MNLINKYMRIIIKEYDIIRNTDGKLERIEIDQDFFYFIFAQTCLFLFKLINWKHTHIKDEEGNYDIKEILDIRGFRTCRYESRWGQIYMAQFCRSDKTTRDIWKNYQKSLKTKTYDTSTS